MRFYIVDVFAESKYAGNQLAVFRDTQGLSTSEMQKIAKEMHYSETTFITSEAERNGGYDVRIFTPDSELPFAGHPTLGTAYIVQSQIVRKPVGIIRLNEKVGQIPVTFAYKDGAADLIWMRQKAPTFGGTLPPASVAEAFGLKSSDIDGRHPILNVDTGVPFMIVPLVSLEAIKKVKFNFDVGSKLLSQAKAMAFLLFTKETYSKKNDLNVRVIGPTPSIPEDPATGSANGCLAAYLLHEKFFGGEDVDARVEQGYEMGRRSLLLLKARKKGRAIEVDVGGRVQFIAHGEFPE